jgi:hypothetical protein
MDTTSVAEHLGTTPRKLRAFLRSEGSTFAAVGSGARYDFTDADLPALRSRWAAWTGTRVPTPAPSPVRPAGANSAGHQAARDRAVWDEEGPIVLADIRDPAVRAVVRARAKAEEARLDALLLAAGLHITQMRVRAQAS